MQLLTLFYREISHGVAERALLYLEGCEFDEILQGVDRLWVLYTREGSMGYSLTPQPLHRLFVMNFQAGFPRVYIST
jgi:hypothetical protein